MTTFNKNEYPNSEVGKARDGDRFFMKESGYFNIKDNDYTAAQFEGMAYNTRGAVTLTNLSTGSTVLSDLGGSSPPILYSDYRVIYLSCTGTMTNGSARLPSAHAGQLLQIRFTPAAGGSTASVLIYLSGHTSGVSGVGGLASTGSGLSSISIRQSAASFAWVELVGLEAGVWAVNNAMGQVTEQSA